MHIKTIILAAVVRCALALALACPAFVARAASPEKTLTVTGTHLIVPVANEGPRQLLGIYDGERLVQNFTVTLPRQGAPHWLAAYPLAPFALTGRVIRIASAEEKAVPPEFAGAFDRAF